MPTFDFDFQRYVERRKGAREAERREGAGFAYTGDLRVRKLLARVRPVTLALEATVRLWRASARAQLLGTARKATELDYPRAYRVMSEVAARLHVETPPLYVSPLPDVSIGTFGTDDEPQVLAHAEICEGFTDRELAFALGAECGRVQNAHVLLGTAHYFLAAREPGFLGWVVRPARASLDAWARRGVVTADRAGLLACRDLEAAYAAMDKLAALAGPAAEPALNAGASAGVTDGKSASASDNQARTGGDPARAQLEARKAALAVFEQGAYYRGVVGATGGLSAEQVEKDTARALAATEEGGA